MDAPDPIPEVTLEKLAKAFYEQGRAYGFRSSDYVRYVNLLLDVVMDAEAAPGPQPVIEGELPLQGDGICVRAFEESDRDALRAWVSEPLGRYFLLSRSTGTVQGLDGFLDDPDHTIGVITLPDGKPVGALAYVQHDPHKAEMRKLIGDASMRGRGLGKQASRLWVGFGLQALGLQKIYLYTLASNQPNIRLNEQLGFRVEGVLRGEVWIDGQPRDVLRMGLVPE